MKKYRDLLITTILCLLPMAIGAYFYEQLPDSMVIHWGPEGPNGWAPKAMACFGMPAIMAALNVLVHFGIDNDPKKKNSSEALKTFVKWLIPVLGFIVTMITILVGLGKDIDVELVVTFLVGIVLIICGNYLPKCKQNYTVGVKCPWTLHSEENWNKTHHISGYLFIIAGIICILTGVFRLPSFIMLIAIFAMGIIPFIYSFILFKKGI